jgi:hypothetical protein
MLTEAALLLRNLLSVSVKTFVIPFYYGSGSATLVRAYRSKKDFPS